jgi:hypothetical protein
VFLLWGGLDLQLCPAGTMAAGSCLMHASDAGVCVYVCVSVNPRARSQPITRRSLSQTPALVCWHQRFLQSLAASIRSPKSANYLANGLDSPGSGCWLQRGESQKQTPTVITLSRKNPSCASLDAGLGHTVRDVLFALSVLQANSVVHLLPMPWPDVLR